MLFKYTLLLAAGLLQTSARPENALHSESDGEEDRHTVHSFVHEIYGKADVNSYDPTEESAYFWNANAQMALSEKLSTQPITGIAKNVILFLGDGMSISTLAAARVYLGQSVGNPGEETQLSFESFPYSGLSKTYCVNAQVADSACSATAYLCGVKANSGTIGVTAAVKRGDCKSMQNASNHVLSIGRWAQLKGKRTGIVTTTRVTHASPAGVYAHTAHRNWENDADVSKDGGDPRKCPDIAQQLVYGATGRNLNVIFGGGRAELLPVGYHDEELQPGLRKDKRNLIEEWKDQKAGSTCSYVWNRDGLLDVPDDTEYVLGLFEKDHTNFNVERDPKKKPSLAEMTEKAIKLLSQGKNGYFLFVEGGRIDQAHHGAAARKALNETVEFHKAVQAAVDLTNSEDTLIVVTSDHSHTMTMNGYGRRGSDILGIGGFGFDKLPYTILSYANGPGYRKERNGKRHDVSKDKLDSHLYKYPALVPLKSETHAGEDVAIFARGPWAHLFTGVNEQNVIPHIMAYASCLGGGITVCNNRIGR